MSVRVRPFIFYLSVQVNLLAYDARAAGPFGLDARSPIGPYLNQKLPPAPPGPTGWTVVPAFPNLTFEDPVFLTHEPGSNRLYAGGRQGTIHFFVNNPSTTTKTLFLDIRSRTQGYNECGLLGMAFHPEYGQGGSPNRGYVYVAYQYSANPVPGPDFVPYETPSYNRLSRFTVPLGSQIADPNSELVLINQYDEYLNHNGGSVFFSSDGFLYFSNGDEGSSNDSLNNTQKINEGLFSGVFRIDVNKDPAKSHPIRRQPQSGNGLPASSSGNYYIPNDNPFLDPAGSILEEFWSLGLRNPHSVNFDPVNQRIWAGDTGQSAIEEINLIEKGGNYQWSFKEGSLVGPKTKPTTIYGIERPPLYEYGQSSGDNCIIGGYVYRGAEHAVTLAGKYIFGDNGSGRVWSLDDGITPPTVTYLCNMPSGTFFTGLSSFGLDQNNELYMCQMGSNGQIWKLARTGTPNPQPPALLSQTGVFANVASLTPAPGLIPYTVNSPLWSDSAIKTRWIAVPNDGVPYNLSEQISFAATGEWTFPAGTVFIKHFELPVDETNPNLIKRLETRLLVRGNSGTVYGATYKWRGDNSDADLLTASLNENIVVATTTGTRIQTWYYPSQQDCLMCHNANAKFVLGVKTRQLNGDFSYPSTGITDNQLRTWNHLNLFSPTLNEANLPTYTQMVQVNDLAATLEHRVRSYLDANCAQCHRPNGVQANFDARYDTPLSSQGIIDGLVNDAIGIAGAKEIAPRSMSQSIMHRRLNTLDTFKMPPLARNTIDTQAIITLADWINLLPLQTTYSTPGSIIIPSAGSATPYPSAITVSGVAGVLSKVTVTLHQITHSWPDDVDVLLVSPTGQAAVLMSDVGHNNAINNVTITFDDAANAILPDASPFTSGTYKTANFGSSSDIFSAPAPAGTYGSTLSNFNGFSPNGTWALYVIDDTIDDQGPISGGWSLTITTTIVSGPTISNLADQTILQHTATTPLAFTVSDADNPANSLLVTSTSSSPTLVPNANIVLGGSGAYRTVTVTPADSQFGTATLTLTVSDGTTSTTDTFVLIVLADADADSMSDNFETANGLNLHDAGDAALDADGDGYTNSQEYQLGTNPTDASDLLSISVTEPSGSAIVVSFISSAGKVYRIECSDVSPAGPWIMLADNLNGNGGVVQAIDTTGANLTKRFYRVVLLP